MAKKIEDRKQSIAKLLNDTGSRSIRIQGDPEGLWFMLEYVMLSRDRHKLKTCAMVKFLDANELVVLIPDKIDTRYDISTCQCFFQKCTFIKGWRSICPHVITEVGDDLIELAQRVTGLIGNPDLCGFVGCEKRYTIKSGLKHTPFVQPKKESNDDIKRLRIKQLINKLLDAAKDKTFLIEGDPDGLWFLVTEMHRRAGGRYVPA